MPQYSIHGWALEKGWQDHQRVGSEVLGCFCIFDRVARADRRSMGDEACLAARSPADYLVNAPALRLGQVGKFAGAAAGQNDMHLRVEQHINMRGQGALVDSIARLIERSADRNADASKVGHVKSPWLFCRLVDE